MAQPRKLLKVVGGDVVGRVVVDVGAQVHSNIFVAATTDQGLAKNIVPRFVP
jgi:hypothetical protein